VKLSALLDEITQGLDTATGRKWSPAQIVQHLNVQQRSLVRHTSNLDEKYHNVTFTLLAANARDVQAGIHSWRMPQGVMKVSAVRRLREAGLARDLEIPRLQKYASRSQYGWELTAQNELELRGVSSVFDLEVLVAKLPPLLTSGTLGSQAGVLANELLLDVDGSATYPHESYVDAYAGALFEITGPASPRKGQVLRCTASTPNQGGGNDQHLLTMEEDWGVAPVASDTYEMHAAIESEHTRLLVLLTIRALFAQERNAEGMASYREEMAEQWAQFRSTIAGRTLAMPSLVVESVPAADTIFVDDPYDIYT